MHIQQTALRRTLWAKTITAAAAMLCAAVAWAESPAASQSGASQIGMEMVDIPAGSFLMGSCRSTRDGCGEEDLKASKDETPQHRVSIKAFQMGKTPVTLGQFKKFIAITGYKPASMSPSHVHHDWFMKYNVHGDSAPVLDMSDDEINALIDWLNKTDGGGWRLPSEAEWEYACRAGGRHTYCGSNNVDEVAWYGENSGGRPHAVASKQPNAFGLYDMSGNVWERVEDCWDDSYYGAPSDGSARVSGCTKDLFSGDIDNVYRGGAWDRHFSDVRAATRWGDTNISLSSAGEGVTGFRLVRTHAGQPAKPEPAARPPQAAKPAPTPAKTPPTPAKPTPTTDTCAGLHNGRFVRVPIKGIPLPPAAMVLEAGEGQMTVRITEGVLAGAKQIRPCTDARP